GTVLKDVVNLPALTNLNYHVVATGGFTPGVLGYGLYQDLLLRDVTSGNQTLWQMQGTTKISEASYPRMTVPPSYYVGAVGLFATPTPSDPLPMLAVHNPTTGANAIRFPNDTTYNLPPIPTLSINLAGPK